MATGCDSNPASGNEHAIRSRYMRWCRSRDLGVAGKPHVVCMQVMARDAEHYNVFKPLMPPGVVVPMVAFQGETVGLVSPACPAGEKVALERRPAQCIPMVEIRMIGGGAGNSVPVRHPSVVVN